MSDQLTPEQLAAAVEADRQAALHRLTSMRIEVGEAHYVLGCLVQSAPAAVQTALDALEAHRAAVEARKALRTTSPKASGGEC